MEEEIERNPTVELNSPCGTRWIDPEKDTPVEIWKAAMAVAGLEIRFCS